MLQFVHVYCVGYCAQYGTYVVIDWQSGYVIAFELVDRRETSCNSKALELCGFLRCLFQLLAEGLQISKFVTDGHLDIKKFFSQFNYMPLPRTKKQPVKFYFAGMLQEEKGHIVVAQGRRAGETALATLIRALRADQNLSNVHLERINNNMLLIQHRMDLWHKSKLLQNALLKVASVRGNEDLLPWIKSLRNYFWLCSKLCKGSVAKMKVSKCCLILA